RPCMQMIVKYNIRAADGGAISQTMVNTVNALQKKDRIDGDQFEGGLQPPPSFAEGTLTTQNLQQGLAASLCGTDRLNDVESESPLDIRRDRLLALAVPSGETPSSLIKPGAFLAIWEGYLQTELQ